MFAYKRHALLILLAPAIALGLTALVACGGGDDDEEATATPVATDEEEPEETDGAAEDSVTVDESFLARRLEGHPRRGHTHTRRLRVRRSHDRGRVREPRRRPGDFRLRAATYVRRKRLPGRGLRGS